MADPGTTAPIETGEEYTVEIEDTGEEGDGVAEIEDFVVLVPEADLGERVTVEIEEIQESFARAHVVDPESDVEGS